MQASAETPRRPRPPAKVRRSLAKGSITPPPAYASTFLFPSGRDEIDGVRSKWDAEDTSMNGADPDTLNNDLTWLSEKSRDELADLLVKADTLIKERENELSLTSAACKSLYENNVSLKTKHETLLHRTLPLSPTPNVNMASSPNQSPHLFRSPLRPAFVSLNRSTSELVADNTSPEYMLSKSYNYNSRRGTSVPTLDISFLADQNAELLSKLEKLESEATSADNAGRRELRRLEKEIGVLKEELEKTQARSDELEEKAKTGFGLGAGKIIEEAWKRKKEREARLTAIRNLKSGWDKGEGPTIRNFAPDAPSMFHGAATSQYPGPDLSTLDEVSFLGEDTPDMQDPDPPVQPDQQLIVKLLQKIQELEATNSKILEHQTETTSRLQAVQRETEFMTKIYERISGFDDQHGAETRDQVADGRLARSHHAVQSQLAVKVRRQRSFSKHESGLSLSTPQKPKSNLPIPFSEGSWGRPRHHSTYSTSSGGLASPALSSLSLYTPPGRTREELSPDVMVGPSLANELGDQWSNPDNTSRLRPRSLSDASVLSTSPSPCIAPTELPLISAQRKKIKPDFSPTPPGPANSLQLSIEPPTPQRAPPITQQQESILIGNMSPRFRVSRSLRARNYLYPDGRYPDPLGPNQTLNRRKRFIQDDSSPTPARGRVGGPLFVEAFHVMMDEFDERNTIVQRESRDADISRSPSPDPEDYADAKEELDETDREPATVNVDETIYADRDTDAAEDEGIYSEENSLSKSQTSEVSKPMTLGGVMLEVWMWLQFAIIMLVFLWAMARKGPKSVMKDAERKRTLSMKKRA